MKKIILPILLSSACAFASTIDTDKRAVTVANVSTLSKANDVAKNLSKYDVYIYKTTQTAIPNFLVYAVNIPKVKVSSTLNNIKNSYKDAYASSKVRINTLASNNFEQNIFISSLKNDKIEVEQNIVEDVITSSNVSTEDKSIEKANITATMTIEKRIEKKEIYIDSNKQAILLGYVSNKKEANKLASKYSDSDTYVYHTVRSGVQSYAVCIVNIAKSDFDFIFNVISKTTPFAKEMSRTRLAYFSNNKTINSSLVVSEKEVVKPKEVVATIDIPKVNVKIENNIDKPALVANSGINSNKKAILVGYSKTRVEAMTLASSYDHSDIYIYDIIKKGQFVSAVYIVNINKEDLEAVTYIAKRNKHLTKKISKIKLKYFSKDDSSANIFIASASDINTNKTFMMAKSLMIEKALVASVNIKKVKKVLPKVSKDKDTKPATTVIAKVLDTQENETTTVSIFKDKFLSVTSLAINTIKVSLLDVYSYFNTEKQKIDKLETETKKHIRIVVNEKNDDKITPITLSKEVVKDDVNLLDFVNSEFEPLKIDTSKKAITIINTISLVEAKKVSDQLSKYDTYIYKTSSKKPLYVVYAINISKKKLSSSLSKIKKTFKDAYKSSDKRVKFLSSNNFLVANYNPSKKNLKTSKLVITASPNLYIN